MAKGKGIWTKAEKMQNKRNMGLYLEEELFEKIRRRAFQEGHSNASETVRRAIIEYLQ